MSTCSNYWNNLMSNTDNLGAPKEWNPTFYTFPDCGAGANGTAVKLGVRQVGDPSARYFPYRNMIDFNYYEEPNHTVSWQLSNIPNDVQGLGAKPGSPFYAGDLNGYGKPSININRDIDSYIIPPNMTVRMSSGEWDTGNASDVASGSYVAWLSDDARFGNMGGANRASSLELYRKGTMQDWTKACCMRDTANPNFTNINEQTCGSFWGSVDKCDSFMSNFCGVSSNTNDPACKCINNIQDPPLPSNVDPQIKALIEGMPQCTKICSGLDPKIYKSSKLQTCNANMNIQVTNCTQNTNIQGADNLISGSNITLQCRPQQSNTTVIPNPPNATPNTTPGGTTNNTDTTDTYNAPQKNNSTNYLLYLLLLVVLIVAVLFIFGDDDESLDNSSPDNQS